MIEDISLITENLSLICSSSIVDFFFFLSVDSDWILDLRKNQRKIKQKNNKSESLKLHTCTLCWFQK